MGNLSTNNMEFVATESNICELLKPLRFLKQLQKCEISNLVHSLTPPMLIGRLSLLSRLNIAGPKPG